MEKRDSGVAASDPNLIKTLTTLNEIGARINRLGMSHDLPTTLALIAAGAVQVVAAGADETHGEEQSEASAVIWVYDEARQDFDANSRVSAGEPDEASIDDFPRPDGLGRQTLQHGRRLLSYETSAAQIHPLKQAAGARALVCCPLIVGGEIVGVLYVYRCDGRRFSEIELLILDNFVHLAAIAIHHGRQVGGLTQALTSKVREMEKLRRATYLISSRTNWDETLREILSIGLDMTAAQYGSFELYDNRRKLLITKALIGVTERLTGELSLPIGKGSVVGWVAFNQQSVLITELREPQWQAIYHPLFVDQEMRSELAVPLIGAGGRLEGVLNIESPQPHAFTEDDQHLLEALATQAISAMQEIRLLDAMQEIAEVLLTSEVDDLLKLIVERACELISISSGHIWLVSEPDTLVLRQSTEAQRLGARLPLRRSITGQAIQLRQPVTIDDVRIHPGFLNRELAVEQGWVSAIVVPLLASQDDKKPIGSFSLYASRLRDFSDWDKKLLTCLANYAAVAIRDAEQLTRLKETQERQAIAETFAAVGDVGANLLHQLNNKFGAISVRVQGIEEKCIPALESWPYLADNLQRIAQSTQQAMMIVRDSMAHLRPIHPQPVDVWPCIERALHRSSVGPDVELTFNGLEDLPRVWAGEKQLEMVFYNLFDNAVKAMAGHGKLQLQGEWTNNEVAIAVTDTGPGIPLELQTRIFEFSSRASHTGEQEAGRLGFGLWWVKNFVDRFGGRIDLESEPGQGSTFTVWLPQAGE